MRLTFSVGQRVEVIENDYDLGPNEIVFKGRKGTVLELSQLGFFTGDTLYQVKLDGLGTWSLYQSELKAVENG